MPSPPWQTPAGIDAVVARWLASGYVKPCLAADKAYESVEGRAVPVPASLGAAARRALAARGIGELYAHQAEALALALAGRHFVVATPTASGKSLCFHLPVLEALSRDREARALYVFPTKALSRDQAASLGELLSASELGAARVVYDGDTPGDARRAARDSSAIVMTNPDMLSASILPPHP